MEPKKFGGNGARARYQKVGFGVSLRWKESVDVLPTHTCRHAGRHGRPRARRRARRVEAVRERAAPAACADSDYHQHCPVVRGGELEGWVEGGWAGASGAGTRGPTTSAALAGAGAGRPARPPGDVHYGLLCPMRCRVPAGTPRLALGSPQAATAHTGPHPRLRPLPPLLHLIPPPLGRWETSCPSAWTPPPPHRLPCPTARRPAAGVRSTCGTSQRRRCTVASLWVRVGEGGKRAGRE